MSRQPRRDDTDVVGARVLAQIVDLVLMVLVFLLAVFLSAFTGGFMSGLAGGSDGLVDAFTGIGFLVGGLGALGYGFILEGLWDGQTVGKRVFGVRAVLESGEPIDAGAAFVRNLPAVVSFGWVAYLVALLSMAASDRRQRVFDRLAGTVVVGEGYGPGATSSDEGLPTAGVDGPSSDRERPTDHPRARRASAQSSSPAQ